MKNEIKVEYKFFHGIIQNDYIGNLLVNDAFIQIEIKSYFYIWRFTLNLN